MRYGICPLSVVPLRSNSSDTSEMVSQILFGEMVEIIEKKGSWTKVRCIWDNYIGWVDTKQINPITPTEFEQYQEKYALTLDMLQGAMTNGHYIPITIGATLPNYDGVNFNLDGSSYTYSGQAVFPKDIKPNAELLIKIARRYLYAPYLWGGRSPLGIDCSGFTQIIFKMIGIQLPRDSKDQVEKGELIDFVEQGQAGDLAFFENRKGKINHVGVLLDENKIIHASGQVRIDKIDHFGIFNEDRKKYTHKLRVVKRVLSPQPKSSEKKSEDESEITNQIEIF